MRPEHRFSKSLQQALEGQGCLVLPIETGPTNRGVPDLYIAKHGRSLWCELKVVSPKQMKEPRTAIQIKRQAQIVSHGIGVINAQDVCDSHNINVEYKLIEANSVFKTVYDLARAITERLES